MQVLNTCRRYMLACTAHLIPCTLQICSQQVNRIFQCTMESLLQDIPSVVVYIDDILIMGVLESVHLQTLEKVLDRLERSGLCLK